MIPQLFFGTPVRTSGLEAEITAGNFTELGSGADVKELLANSRWRGDPKTVNAKNDAPKMVFAKGNFVNYAYNLESNQMGCIGF